MLGDVQAREIADYATAIDGPLAALREAGVGLSAPGSRELFAVEHCDLRSIIYSLISIVR
jgi:hypothetical protein